MKGYTYVRSYEKLSCRYLLDVLPQPFPYTARSTTRGSCGYRVLLEASVGVAIPPICQTISELALVGENRNESIIVNSTTSEEKLTRHDQVHIEGDLLISN